MKRKAPKNELERKLYRSFMLLSVIVILASLGGTLYFDILRQRKDVDSLISGVAAYIAGGAEVVAMIENGYPSPEVKQSLDALYATIPNFSVAVVCNRDGVRFYHTDRQQTGESYVDGEELPILQGSEPYITNGYGTLDTQRRAFHGVRNQQGEVIGFVMVSVFMGVISARLKSIVLLYLMILAAMLLISAFVSFATLRSMRNTLMGFRPEELLRRYLRQDVVLSAVAEGLVASDAAGRILFVNSVARDLLNVTCDPEGLPVRDLLPDSRQDQILRTGLPDERRSWFLGGHSVLASEIPIRKGNHSPVEGVLTMLYDRTEMQTMADELFGARSMIDALRTYNHEFSNKLHVILGYLETGQVEKATHFIINTNLISGQMICQTADLIRVSDLCALIVGKMLHAAERGIECKLMGDSCCISQDLLIPVGDMVTILGNLAENAIEELSRQTVPSKEIKLGLFCRPDCNLLVCQDSGPGIAPEILPKIFDKGFSTKGEYRGTGLYTVHRLVQHYGGKLEVETETGMGSVFTATFTREEMDGCIRS